MILADTSAWIEFLRGTGSGADRRFDGLLAGDPPLASTDVVLMEVLAGARDGDHRDRLMGLLGRAEMLPVVGPADYVTAADVYRACRRRGETIRKLTDCLIAVVAMRHDAEVLTLDQDFAAIARHAPLRLA